eukprot:TRINITY_DN2843_c0_g1_i1.p1 TRINITY_DN2843_c0_g1~~TRINITY_DN2843_c0_g1_i1.p1  ORF type:complete len:489 (-),score=148.62 TRINITY_DN2843_c0_g1_i1:119-1585(-)
MTKRMEQKHNSFDKNPPIHYPSRTLSAEHDEGYTSDASNPESSKHKDKLKKKYKVDGDKDGFPTVFLDEDIRQRLFSHVPLVKVKKLKKNVKILNTIAGPNDIQFSHEALEPFVCGRSISTYPHIPGKPNRDGDPICDSYCVQMLEDDVVIALVCDGCSWGRRPMEASNTAKSSFVEYLKAHLGEINELRDAGHYLLQALSYCHHKICEGKEDVWEAGTTTLLGGMLLRVKKTKEEVKAEGLNAKDADSFRWVWICVSIGDCKAFHFSAAAKTVIDITKGNRRNVYDPKDCGGRLGPYVGNGQPDLGNVMVYYTYCEENDLIMILSDGVHDNLDPQVLGKPPRECGAQFEGIKEWAEFGKDEDSQLAKIEYMKNFLMFDLILGGETDEKLRSKVFSQMIPDEPLSPANILSRIMKHCLSITSRGREWMEQNPREKLPNDYVTYPGKMDHATAVILRVANFEKELAKTQGPKSPEKQRRLSEGAPNAKK